MYTHKHTCTHTNTPTYSHLHTSILQFNMAKSIPGKEEFHETIRYFNKQLKLTGLVSILSCIYLQRTSAHCNTLQRTATHCNTLVLYVFSLASSSLVFYLFHTLLQCVTMCCSCCSVLQCLQCVAVFAVCCSVCSVLYCVAVGVLGNHSLPQQMSEAHYYYI